MPAAILPRLKIKLALTDSARVSGAVLPPLQRMVKRPMSPPQIIADAYPNSPSHPELEGQRVFLSGIAETTGEAIARSFAGQRARLVLHSRQEPSRATALADGVSPLAAGVRLFSGDIGSDQAACERLSRAGMGAFNGIDLLINFITMPQSPDASGFTVDDFELRAADALRPALVLARAVADYARNSGRPATVMHVGLARANRGADLAGYGMLKAGLEAMAQDQARRWFNHDVCVYAFVPGLPDESFDDEINVVPARNNFDASLAAILLNAASGRSRWLNGVTVAIPS
jgi:NAD(P)-dependent dehydrogenase (short-subunit alcohol dehydrogenase family)